MRVHIFGAAGSGATTLGLALSQRLSIPHFDTDDVYWLPTDPPYTTKRPLAERKRMLRDKVAAHERWVLSGSLISWSDAVEDLFTHIIFVSLDQAVRLERLRTRELARYGDKISLGGAMYAQSQEFLTWAAQYESGRLDMRTRASHELWLARFDCPILRLESREAAPTLVESAINWLNG